MPLPDALVFASPAKIAGACGIVFLALAGIANFAERRRIRRARIDRIGWMPWTGIFLTCAVIGASLLAFAAGSLGGS
jgi:hypothetical protein